MHLAKDWSFRCAGRHHPRRLRVFGAIQHHPLSPGDSSLCPTALPTNPVILIHSHLVTFSGVSVANLIVLIFTALVLPSSVSPESSLAHSLRPSSELSSPEPSRTLPPAPGTWPASSLWPRPCALPWGTHELQNDQPLGGWTTWLTGHVSITEPIA